MLKLGKLSTIYVGCVALFLPVSAYAQTDLLLGPGDVLRVTIASAPNLDRTLPVGPTGTITFPLLGELTAAGRTIAEIEAEVTKKIATTFYRQLGGDDERLVVIRPEEIAIEVERYRPIYVDGAVNNPGEMPYRAGLTARQAVSASGGVFAMQEVARNNLAINLAQVTADYKTRVVELAGALTDLARVRAQIDGLTTIDAAVLDGMDLSPEIHASLVELANARLVADKVRAQDESAYNLQAIERAQEQVRIALQQAEAAAGAYASEAAEVRRIEASGTLYSAERLAQAKRTMLQTNAQVLNFRSDVAQLRNEERALVRAQENNGKDLQTALLDNVRELSLRIETLRFSVEGLLAERQALEKRMGVALGDGGDLMTISVIRIIDGKAVLVEADKDETLQPGDVVTVSL